MEAQRLELDFSLAFADFDESNFNIFKFITLLFHGMCFQHFVLKKSFPFPNYSLQCFLLTFLYVVFHTENVNNV